ncbi:hypothetical protein [Kingella potus]|nr:hypothetical protein [Kingella potus]UOP01086.1 hypothetical protein LVJ84_01630 [Kingella potus]
MNFMFRFAYVCFRRPFMLRRPSEKGGFALAGRLKAVLRLFRRPLGAFSG